MEESLRYLIQKLVAERSVEIVLTGVITNRDGRLNDSFYCVGDEEKGESIHTVILPALPCKKDGKFDYMALTNTGFALPISPEQEWLQRTGNELQEVLGDVLAGQREGLVPRLLELDGFEPIDALEYASRYSDGLPFDMFLNSVRTHEAVIREDVVSGAREKYGRNIFSG